MKKLLAEDKTASAAQLSARAKEIGKPVGSASTVSRILRANGFKNYRRPRRSRRFEGDTAKRVNFCKKCRTLTGDTLLFVDEKNFDTNDHGPSTQWAQDRSQVLQRDRQNFAPGIQVFGAIGVDFKFLIVLPDKDETGKRAFRLNAELYRKHCLEPLLKELRKKRAKKTLVQDGAKSHSARTTSEFLKEQRFDVLDDWPPRSPDLNPIETLWAWLQPLVSAHNPKTAEDLRKAVQAEWDKLEQEKLNRLVRSFPRAVQTCISRRGK